MNLNKKILFFILLAGVLIFPLQAMGVVPQALATVLTNINDVIKTIGTALIVVGFVVAGIMYLISGGNPEKTGTAKKALIAAVIGSIIVMLAYATDGIVKILKEILPQ